MITKSFKIPWSAVFSLAFLLLSGLLVVTIKVTGAREGGKVLEPEFARQNPVIFRDVQTKDGLGNIVKFRLGENLSVGDNWLKDTSFRVVNIARKPIVYLDLNLNFPDAKSETTGPKMSYSFSFGRRPGSKFLQTEPPLFIKTGESLQVALDKNYGQIVEFLGTKHFAIQNMNKVQLRVGFVAFADNTGWMAGMFYKQDPNDSSRYIPGDVSPFTKTGKDEKGGQKP